MEATEMVDLISRLGSDENVPARVRTLREAEGWSLQDLADALAEAGHLVNKSTLWKIESGTPVRQISFREAAAFARVFGIPVAHLYLTDGQLAQREVASGVNLALQKLTAAHEAWIDYGNAVAYAQNVLDRAEDRDAAVRDLERARQQLQRKEQRKAVALWRRWLARRLERGEQVPELLDDDEAVLASEDFARFVRTLSEQPTYPAIDDILSGADLRADALLPGRARERGAH